MKQPWEKQRKSQAFAWMLKQSSAWQIFCPGRTRCVCVQPRHVWQPDFNWTPNGGRLQCESQNPWWRSHGWVTFPLYGITTLNHCDWNGVRRTHEEILWSYGFWDILTRNTPMKPNTSVSKDDCDPNPKPDFDCGYRGFVDSLGDRHHQENTGQHICSLRHVIYVIWGSKVHIYVIQFLCECNRTFNYLNLSYITFCLQISFIWQLGLIFP